MAKVVTPIKTVIWHDQGSICDCHVKSNKFCTYIWSLRHCRCPAFDRATKRSASHRQRHRQLPVPSQRQPGAWSLLAESGATHRRRPPALHGRRGTSRRVATAYRAGQSGTRWRQRCGMCSRERHWGPSISHGQTARLPRRTRLITILYNNLSLNLLAQLYEMRISQIFLSLSGTAYSWISHSECDTFYI